MNNRIGLLLKVKDVTASKFAEMIGVQPSNISHILSGRNKPSLDFITKVCDTFPDISIDWLMFGRGSMFLQQSEQIIPQQKDVEKEIVSDHQQIQHSSSFPDLFSQDYPSENVTNPTQNTSDDEYEKFDDLTEEEEKDLPAEEEIEHKNSVHDNANENFKTENFHKEIVEATPAEPKDNIVSEDKQRKEVIKPVKIVLIYPDDTFEIIESRERR